MHRASKAATIQTVGQNESENAVCSAPILADATPAMQQYLEIKSTVPDMLLFYRMGDFYELFFDDAKEAAALLEIALTRRGKHQGAEIPMCGVPVHSAEMYLQKLIGSGRKVAICEQLETPAEAKKRGSKAVVRREIVRLVTPGTITEEAILVPNAAQYLLALVPPAAGEAQGAAAWLDLSTGECAASPLPLASMPALLARIDPREILLGESTQPVFAALPWFEEWRTRVTTLPAVQFSQGARRVASHFSVADAQVFGAFGEAELAACGALLGYVALTQRGAVARINPPQREALQDTLVMDAATRRNLELISTLRGTRRGSLLDALDATATAAGGRLLMRWISAPCSTLPPLLARLDTVEFLLAQPALRDRLRAQAAAAGDLERAVGRLCLGRGGPRDLLLIRACLVALRETALALQPLALPALLSSLAEDCRGHHALEERLTRELKPQAPMLARDGDFVAEGVRADLDEYRMLRDESRRMIAAMERDLRERTGIASLKIRHNQVLGYYIEVTAIHEKKVPPDFIHRQGLAGALRYTTPELNETARKIEQAAGRALSIELEVFEEWVGAVLGAASGLIAAAQALATLDVLRGFAALAERWRWVRPQLREDIGFHVTRGRHPVVEAALQRAHREFIGNDCQLAQSESPLLLLLTGPNMGGKSTYLRQQAALVVMAQIGCFVPADAAELGLVDMLFCRVGAADDLARGQSTFMVEMAETAAILHQAGPRALVVLDEIGRGTATYDGVSIAWAVAEYLHEVTRCRALFATHYHELTALAGSLPRLRNFHATATEHQGQLVFTHRITPGAADQSYGIHVAALAGLPARVLSRARQLLRTLEEGHSLAGPAGEHPPASGFVPPPPPEAVSDGFALRLRAIEPDDLSPRQAWEMLAALAREAREG